MAKNQYAGAMEYQAKIQKKLDFAKIKVQCQCYHHGEDSMNFSLVKWKEEKDGQQNVNKLLYKCTNCWKIINIRNMPDDVRKDSIAVVDAMIDLIKMKCDPKKPEEAKLIEKLAKLQFQLIGGLDDLYKAQVLGQGKKKNKKKKSGGDGSSNSTWGKPVYGRR